MFPEVVEPEGTALTTIQRAAKIKIPTENQFQYLNKLTFITVCFDDFSFWVSVYGEVGDVKANEETQATLSYSTNPLLIDKISTNDRIFRDLCKEHQSNERKKLWKNRENHLPNFSC